MQRPCSAVALAKIAIASAVGGCAKIDLRFESHVLRSCKCLNEKGLRAERSQPFFDAVAPFETRLLPEKVLRHDLQASSVRHDCFSMTCIADGRSLSLVLLPQEIGEFMRRAASALRRTSS